MCGPLNSPGSSPWIIIGAGGHGAAVAEVLAAAGETILAFVDEARVHEGQRFGFEIMPDLPPGHLDDGCPIALAVGDNFQRQQLSENLKQRGATEENFPAIAHPSASVSRFARIECGAVILQGAQVGPAANVGRFCVVATGASLTHDAVMADYSFVSTNAVLGAATLGERSFVGFGSVVNAGSRVGDDVVIGAQSFVRGEIEDCVVAHGSPAQVSRRRSVGEAYLR